MTAEPETPNQCMGCQAGWRIRVVPETRTARMTLPAFEVHQVEGGYRNEIVACTRRNYTP